MNKLTLVQNFAQQLPNKELTDFYGELLDNIMHDERSYGPSPFTTILSSLSVSEENNPQKLYVSVVEKATEEDKDSVIKEAFDYFQGILDEFFYSSIHASTTDKDISEDDLPF